MDQKIYNVNKDLFKKLFFQKLRYLRYDICT